MPKVLITTVPFAEKNELPLRLLKESGIHYEINPLARKLTEDELANLVCDFDILIAGTEQISDKVMSCAKSLKLISRVGIGLDGVDLLSAKNRGINVSYTPDAPAPAVAELTLGLIFSLLRHINIANLELHKGHWRRHSGRRVSEIQFGIIGAGRIGRRVIDFLEAFGARILVHDSNPSLARDLDLNVEWTTLDNIFNKSDLISLHVPLTGKTRNMITFEELERMKPNAMIINTSRGGIINENALYQALKFGHLGGAALDVFEQEPYTGPLSEIDRCILTSHMGSMSDDCRARMEIEATEEAVRFCLGKPLQNQVPQSEYILRETENSNTKGPA